MAKFRFIITDTLDGCLKGTNDEEAAQNLARSEDFFVYDSQEGVWIDSALEMQELKEV